MIKNITIFNVAELANLPSVVPEPNLTPVHVLTAAGVLQFPAYGFKKQQMKAQMLGSLYHVGGPQDPPDYCLSSNSALVITFICTITDKDRKREWGRKSSES